MSRDFYLALAVFCSDYHSGQWSRGYRLLCKAGKRLGRLQANDCHKIRNTEHYKALARKFGNSI